METLVAQLKTRPHLYLALDAVDIDGCSVYGTLLSIAIKGDHQPVIERFNSPQEATATLNELRTLVNARPAPSPLTISIPGYGPLDCTNVTGVVAVPFSTDIVVIREGEPDTRIRCQSADGAKAAALAILNFVTDVRHAKTMAAVDAAQAK